jgi:two-component system, chemotaxis family, CheB/CheR fusion protein
MAARLERFVLPPDCAGAAGEDESAMTEREQNERLNAVTDESARDFHVVGVGASAGGLEALEKFFSHLPADTGMAFVVLQHLSPDFKSLMDELLARRTSMPVRIAEHDMPLEPNCVYLLPPMKEMIVRQRHLLLNDKDPRHGLALPIDLFFRSLAQDIGDRAIGVILSGSGSDGSRGITEISRAGGVVFCESSDTAQFSGMPLSAMRTGTVDQVLPPEEIAMAIAALARPRVEAEPDGEPSCEDRGVDLILRLLRDEYGIDFSHYKASTVTRRIERRLALNRSLDIDAYVDQLRSDPRELNLLYEDLLIGVTRFFRDDAAFEVLEQRIIPDIIERTDPHEPIRVWVPGCATGQEAYSIAILLHEQLTSRRRAINVKILATDVHKTSLEVASAGLYAEPQIAGITQDRLERFFTPRPEGYQISQQLRESIVFAPHNLIRDAPFTKLDLITCRNLLIYFQPHAQKTVLTLFHFCLKPGGYMFLGSSESPGGLLDEFDTIDEHAKIYRKRRDIALPRDLKLPLPRSAAAPRALPALSPRTTGVHPALLGLYDRLLDRFMPPSFLVDQEGQLVDSFGGVASLLTVKQRRPSQNLLDMLGEDLRTVVSGALHRVRRDQEVVRYDGVPIPDLGRRFTVVAEPIRTGQPADNHVLISLVPVDDGASAAAAANGSEADIATLEPAPAGVGLDVHVTRDHLHAIEDELAYTKENLQAAIEEHETTNEELQATNEELIASNEELQSTNEELHSVNEELYTVNAEYQKRNVELMELNDDIEHLLNGTDVATIFLDRELRIRKFTPRIADIFEVIPHDVGRPIRAFAHSLSHDTLMDDIERVLRDGTTIEAQTTDGRGRCYFLRILPYRARTKEAKDPAGLSSPLVGRPGPPDGVVLTLTDISTLEQVRAKLAQLSAIVESSDDAIVGKTLDGIITSWNNGACRLYGYTAEEAIGRHVNFLQPADRKHEIDAILAEVREGRPVERMETARVRKDGERIDVSVKFSPIMDSSNAIAGVSAISRDISPLIRAREEVAEREEQIRLLLDSTAEAIYGIDLSGVCIFCNPACARLLGYDSPAALIGRQMHPLIHHTRADGTPYPAEQSRIYDAMRHREEAHVDNEVLWRADGTSFPAEYWSHPILRQNEIIGAVVTFLDVTERRQAEAEVQEGVKRREQFLAMLSHELRNPLAAILSATRFLEGSAVADSVRLEAGLVVERQAKHMARLLDDLLDVARITRGRIVLRTERVDLRETTRSAIEALGPFMAERESHLSLAISDEPVRVVGDPTRLQQIQANLLSNASKYSPRGAHIHLQVATADGQAMIRVKDDGHGIEPDVLPRIFDLFVQGDQSLARSEGGLGIGLTLLRSLVELHNGRVEAKSDGRGRGSEFTVWLPLAPAAVTAADNDGRVRRGPVKTVVLVEDQADARRMMQLLLESHGVKVFAAENGMEGTSLIESVRPDLALVDLGLPVMSGFEVARRVRERAESAATRLVALSGYGQDSDIQAALEAGFDEHLTKPPDPDRLEQLLAGGASGKWAERQQPPQVAS